MDKPFIVLISGTPHGTYKTLEAAEQAAKDNIASRKKAASAIIYQAVEIIEPVMMIPNWKVTPAGQLPEPQPEPGYQPEGFDSLTAEASHRNGYTPQSHSGFGDKFGTEF